MFAGMTAPVAISTHDLTKRSTLEGIIETKPMVISTHDLTKRSTSGFRITAYSNIDFNSRPHEEVDWFSRAKEMHKDISTHDLTKRSTFLLCKNIFENNFNSRPHEEVDCVVLNLCVLWNISTHDLTKRSTWGDRNYAVSETFQLTTSRRGRHRKATL